MYFRISFQPQRAVAKKSRNRFKLVPKQLYAGKILQPASPALQNRIARTKYLTFRQAKRAQKKAKIPEPPQRYFSQTLSQLERFYTQCRKKPGQSLMEKSSSYHYCLCNLIKHFGNLICKYCKILPEITMYITVL